MAIEQAHIDMGHVDQRVDNFLLTCCKGVPKTRIYKALRTGEVRVNGRRVKPEYRLMLADVVRIPPFRVALEQKIPHPDLRFKQGLEQAILEETDTYIAINKPSGIPVHGGTKVHLGLIEGLRQLRPRVSFMELVHRIDKETSGVLLVAKKRSLLIVWQKMMQNQQVKKRYYALLSGEWPTRSPITVTAPLRKNVLASGERIVVVADDGKSAKTIFTPIEHFRGATLVEARLITGRTHQIRVHAASIGHPVAGDRKYGNESFNRTLKRQGLTRLFLHAHSLAVVDGEDKHLRFTAPMPPELKAVLSKLKADAV